MKTSKFDEKLQRRRFHVLAYIAIPIPLLLLALVLGLTRRNHTNGSEAFNALHTRRLASTGVRVSPDAQAAYAQFEQTYGQVTEHRFEQGIYQIQGNLVNVSGFTKRRQSWHRETFAYAVKTSTITNYTCTPLHLDDAAFTAKYGP